MKKIILSYCHYQGWGDSMISIFDILNLTDFLKKKYDDLYVTFIINDVRNIDVGNTLERVFDLKFFENFFDVFKIQIKSFDEFNNFGTCNHEGLIYNRIYSGRNFDVKNNVPGIFDLYAESSVAHFFEKYSNNYLYFTFDEFETKNILNFPIFNKEIIKYVDEFVKNNFDEEFESICYRANNVFDKNKIEKLIKKLDINKKYFLCSNSSEIKKLINESVPNIQMIRGFKNDTYNLEGFPVGDKNYMNAFLSVCELYALGKSKKIYYEGEMPWISFFVWYARNVCKIELVS